MTTTRDPVATVNRRTMVKALGAALVGGGLLRVPDVASAQDALSLGYYSGTATTLVRFFDAGGGVVGEQAYQNAVLARVGTPAVVGVERESNPFNFYVIPDPPESTGDEGVWEIHSALGFSEQPGQPVISPITGEEVPSSAGGTHVTSGGRFLVQYWTLQRTSETEFVGALTNPHTAEAIALNLINAPAQIAPGISLPWPYPMATGTELVGASDGQTLQVTVGGRSIDQAIAFLAEVQATRIA
jgi:hypothetical protein